MRSNESFLRAEQHLTKCALCEHRCGANRLVGEHAPCQAGSESAGISPSHRIWRGDEAGALALVLLIRLRSAVPGNYIAESQRFNPRSRHRALGVTFLPTQFAGDATAGARNIEWVGGGAPTIQHPGDLAGDVRLRRAATRGLEIRFLRHPGRIRAAAGNNRYLCRRFPVWQRRAAHHQLALVDRYVAIVTRNLRYSRPARLISSFGTCCCPGSLTVVIVRSWATLARELPGVKFGVRAGYLPRWQAHHYGELAQPLDRNVAAAARELATSTGLNVVD